MKPPSRQKLVRTASDIACDTIREKILSGELKPGSKLTRRGMAKLSGVSVIPVIEAMYKLEQEGLVESIPLEGSRVVTLNDERIQDIFALREAIECQVARMLAGNMDAEQEASFRELAATLDANLYSESSEYDARELWKVHYQFHIGLASLTGCNSLADSLHRVNLFDLLQGVVERNRKRDLPEDWHRRLVDALVNGDPDRAEAAMRAHVRSSLPTKS